jgi:hypothetical protein
MSEQVDLDRLLEVASGFGTVPMLLTTGEDGRPRAAAVTVSWHGELASVRAGHRSLGNAGRSPLVTLLWPAPPGERFALLVDGTVETVRPDPPPDGTDVGRRPRPGGVMTLRPTSAILHVVSRSAAG